jgi:hypothetical protein
VRLAEPLNAPALLVDEYEDLIARSIPRCRNKTPHLVRAFDVAREKDKPGGTRRS